MMSAVAEKSRVLIVDDEPQITRVLKTVLTSQGYQVRTASEGESALANFTEWRPELVITDLYMPHMDGIELCRRIRAQSNVPIIVLSVKGEEGTKVEALDSGADDYVTKPFAFEELLARVEALGRRPKEIRDPVLRVGDLELDTATREVRRAGSPIELTPKEYTVLEYLMRHTGRVMSRTLITEYAWDYHFDPGTNIVDVVINRLRKKVDSGHAHKLVHTVRGVGYVVKA
jgi:two-component system copper resistance phosphate regulon response regulator CusR